VNQTYTLTSQTNNITDESGNTIFRIKTSEAAASWSTSKTMSYTLTILYAAKTDGKNWTYASDGQGYSSPVGEMDETTEEDLIYFTTLQALYDYFGYDEDGNSNGVCVAILYEFRDCCIRNGRSVSVTSRMEVTNEFEDAGQTFCTTNDARGWTTYRPEYKSAFTAGTLSAQLFNFTWTSAAYGTANGATAYGTATGSYPDSYTTAYNSYSAASGGYSYSGNAKLERYDNGYIKTEYENGWVVGVTHSGWYSGNTLLLYTMESGIDIEVADTEEGSNTPKATYKIGNERTASFTVTPTIVESSGVSNELVTNGTQSTEVVVTISLPNHLNFDAGSLTFDYSNSGYQEGDLVWEVVYTESDAAYGEEGYGTATIVLTTSVTDISKALPTINYTCTIGNPNANDGDADEVSDGETLKTTATINITYEESGQISTYAKEDAVTISVIKISGDNIWIEGSGLLELGESMVFDLYYGNNSTAATSVEVGNVLPYNNDGRGTEFTGGYQVTGLTLTFDSAASLENFLQYGAVTFDTEAIYSKDSDDQGALLNSLLSGGTVLYSGSSVSSYLSGLSTTAVSTSLSTYYSYVNDSTSGTYTVTFDLTALDSAYQEMLTQLASTTSGIAFYVYLNGVQAGETVQMSYTLSPSTTSGGGTSLIADVDGTVQTGENTYMESTFYRVASTGGGTNGSVTSTIRSISYINRILSGIAWLDQDNDGHYNTVTGSTDQTLAGIDVYLYSTTPTEDQTYYNYYGTTITGNTGQNGEIISYTQTIIDGNTTTPVTLYPLTLTKADGTTITLYPAVNVLGNLINYQTTGTNGAYSFEELAEGTYYVVFQDDIDNSNNSKYTVADSDDTPLPFEQLSVTTELSSYSSTAAVNRASASYGGANSSNSAPSSLVLAYIGGIEMPKSVSVSTYEIGNRNTGFYYRQLTVQKIWENLIEEIDAGTSVTFTVTGTSKAAAAYTYENTYVLTQATNTITDPSGGGTTDGTVTAEYTSNESSLGFEEIIVATESGNDTKASAESVPSGYAVPSLTVASSADTSTGLSTVTWTLGTINLQAKDNYGEITYSLSSVTETEEVDNGNGNTKTQTLTGFVTETAYTETQSTSTSAKVIKAKATNTQILYELQLYKISTGSDGTSGTLYLAGATFTLYSDESCASGTEVTSITGSASGTSGSDATSNVSTSYDSETGKLYIGKLAAGTYYLKETGAPSGYALNKSVWKIDISYNTSNPTTPVITVTLVKDENGNDVSNQTPFTLDTTSTTGGTDKYYLAYDSSSTLYTLSFQMKNVVTYSLPATGSVGIVWPTLAGIALMLAALVMNERKRWKMLQKAG